jgi:DNA-damage-inducible protein J
MAITDVVRSRIGHGVKERAAAALADMGFSISDAIRLLKVGVGEECWLPLEANAANTITSRGAAELEGRQAKAFARIADFMADLRNEGF